MQPKPPKPGRPQWNSTLKRRTPLRSGGKIRSKSASQREIKIRPSGLKKIGKKGAEWQEARKKVTAGFLRAGIRCCCEVCGSTFALGYAHSRPRRYIKGDEIYEVALLCSICHSAADHHGHEHQYRTIREIIAARRVPVVIDP